MILVLNLEKTFQIYQSIYLIEIINEYDLVREILSQYSLQKVDKFVQEVFWRVYWKGWLEHRPRSLERFCRLLLQVIVMKIT